MKFNRRFQLLTILYGCVLSACSFRVVAPPARLGFAESPKVTPEGETKYSLDGMGGGQIFGPEILAVGARISKGLSQNRELNFGPVAGMVNKDGEKNQNNTFYGLAIDLKKQLNPAEEWWAVSCWGGGGYVYSAFGQIYSTHGGIAIGQESHWFRPFVSSDLFMSFPVHTKPIIGYKEESTFSKRLTNTVGIKTAVGIKLQFTPKLAATTAGSVGVANSQTDQIEYLLLGQSFEWGF